MDVSDVEVKKDKGRKNGMMHNENTSLKGKEREGYMRKKCKKEREILR